MSILNTLLNLDDNSQSDTNINIEDKPLVTNDKIRYVDNKTKQQTQLENRDYIKELKQKLISRLVSRYINYKPTKQLEYFSATTITQCPKLLWYQYKGKITEDMIDKNKLFYLLDIYAKMGDTVHSYIYKTLEFESTEEYIVDKDNHLSGRYDIYDQGNLIDIKSSQTVTDVSPQLSIYYYLVSVYLNKPVKHVYVWWVLKDYLQELDISKLKQLYPLYIQRAHNLYKALSYDDYPHDLVPEDYTLCEYCPIEKWCKSSSIKLTNNKKSTQNSSNNTTNPTPPKPSDIDFLL